MKMKKRLLLVALAGLTFDGAGLRAWVASDLKVSQAECQQEADRVLNVQNGYYEEEQKLSMPIEARQKIKIFMMQSIIDEGRGVTSSLLDPKRAELKVIQGAIESGKGQFWKTCHAAYPNVTQQDLKVLLNRVLCNGAESGAPVDTSSEGPADQNRLSLYRSSLGLACELMELGGTEQDIGFDQREGTKFEQRCKKYLRQNEETPKKGDYAAWNYWILSRAAGDSLKKRVIEQYLKDKKNK